MKDIKIATAIAAVTTIAVTASFVSMLNSAGKDFGYSPKSSARYQDSETGNLFDKDGNRIPW